MHQTNKRVAYHEAGHAVAHILTGIPFDYVTIDQHLIKDEKGKRSLGQVVVEKCEVLLDGKSILDPYNLYEFFKQDFINMAGYVAEMIYLGETDIYNSKEDFKRLVAVSLNRMPE